MLGTAIAISAIAIILKGNAKFCGDLLAQNHAVTPTFVINFDVIL